MGALTLGFLANSGHRLRHRCLSGLAVMLASGTTPTMVQAHPALSTDLVSQDDMIAVAGSSQAVPVHRHLDVAFIDLTETRGRLRYGVTFQYGSTFATNPNDYIGHEADHRSLRIDREIFVGATAAYRAFGPWRLVASAGRLQLHMHGGFETGRLGQGFSEPTLMGWRVVAGVERPVGPLVMTLGWQMTRFAGEQGSDPEQPTHASASRISLELKTTL